MCVDEMEKTRPSANRFAQREQECRTKSSLDSNLGFGEYAVIYLTATLHYDNHSQVYLENNLKVTTVGFARLEQIPSSGMGWKVFVGNDH